MTAHLRRLIDPALLILVAVFAAGLRLALGAGLFGIPLALILVSWLFKYAYVLLEEVAHGIQTPRVMSIEMVNPVEQRPLAQLAICLAAVMAMRAVHGWIALVLAGVLAGVLPASIAILGASGNVLQAINPVALVRVIAVLGRYYVILLAFVAAAAIGAWGLLATTLPLTWKFACLIFAILATFNLIGGVLYERREALDLPTVQSPEQSRERDQRELVRNRSHFIDELYALARARKYAELEEPLDRWLAGIEPLNLDTDGRALIDAARSWGDPRTTSIVVRSVVRNLRAARQNAAALDVVEAALAADSQIAPLRCIDSIEFAELAVAAGRRPLARRLLESAASLDPDEYETRRLSRLRQALHR